ncbi:MAG: LLM class flavin-dependent oxidoreductase, partial [Deltaproteobacteria bacterium]|nr:LLM class flavin-dependent oxidoreductase [Deltaproteobacteria bacterium]
LHHMCRGGFNLGVGSGEAESLVPFGYPFDKPVGRCEEFLAELRCLLDTGRMPQGGPGRIGVPLESAMGKPKLWVAGHGPRMLRLTGQYADGWLPAWRTTPPGATSWQSMRKRRGAPLRHADSSGRSSSENPGTSWPSSSSANPSRSSPPCSSRVSDGSTTASNTRLGRTAGASST